MMSHVSSFSVVVCRQGLQYLYVKIEAFRPDENVRQHFSKCNDFIHAARVSNQTVLAHCHGGVSRSVTLSCAYLMTITKLGLRDVLSAVRAVCHHFYRLSLLLFAVALALPLGLFTLNLPCVHSNI